MIDPARLVLLGERGKREASVVYTVAVRFIFVLMPVIAVSAVTASPLKTVPASESNQQVREIVYPRKNALNDPRNHYPAELLRLALSKVEKSYRLAPSKVDIPQRRALVMLAQGREMDVLWFMTTDEREKILRPIRIPIYKGMGGWRLLMIKAGDAPRFARLSSEQALGKLVAGQGHD